MYNEEVRTLPNVDEEGVIALAGAPPGRLRRLNLAFNRVGDRGVAALAGAAALDGLEWLNVYEEHDGPALLGPGESLTEGQQSALRQAITRGLLSSAHDCSDGGLLVALAECCV